MALTRRAFSTVTMASLVAGAHGARARAEDEFSYDLTVEPGTARIMEPTGPTTAVWAYNQTVPGPLLAARKGKPLVVRVTNKLPQPTTVHWHGIRIDNAMDGVANLTQPPIEPGESFVYAFTPPDAGTFWYHPHNRSWEQMARGLSGALIVSGDEAETYDRDLTLVADDWRLNEDGKLDEASFGNFHDWSHAGRLGNFLTLNGQPVDTVPVINGERVRLRFINAANARVMTFTIEGQRPWVMALDGQSVAPARVPDSGFEIAPGQRIDMVLDIAGAPGERFAIAEISGGEAVAAGHLVCQNGSVRARTGRPAALLSNDLPPGDLAAARSVELLMTGGAMSWLRSAVYKGQDMDGRTLAREYSQVWALDGTAGMPDTPLFTAKRGETIKITMINDTLWPHAMHTHGHHCRILSRQAPGASAHDIDTMRDTILMAPRERTELIMRADNPGKWMLHCHMLEHQAGGMATWFQVL